ncbi:MAG: hypothetical protein Q9157_004678, partial [Trypethelium eluteriae]
RLKEMKQMQREGAASKNRRAERKADEKSGLVSLKPMKMEFRSSGTGGGFKKGGFKNAFASAEAEPDAPLPSESDVVPSIESTGEEADKDGDAHMKSRDDEEENDEEVESDLDGLGEEYYDPRKPTDCHAQCPAYVT